MSEVTTPLQNAAPAEVTAGFIGEQELASQLGVSIRTLRRWEVSRTGPPRVVIGRKVRYQIVSVREWMKARETRRGRGRR